MLAVATAPLTVKLRCASWRQLRTIYERDLAREAFFLKSKKPPPIGTAIRIQLTLPSESMVILRGAIESHVPEGGMNGRGPGIDIKLNSIPQSAMWLIETALDAETSSQDPVAARQTTAPRAGTAAPAPEPPPKRQPSEPPPPSMDSGKQESDAEVQLLEALAEEYESLQKLNPFQILGVGYEVGDEGIRTAFGELTKKYHPDRFRRFENDHVREYASEIFILIRNAYQQLGTEASRKRIRQGLKTGSVKRSFKPPTLPHLRERHKLEHAETMLSGPDPLPSKQAAKPAAKPPPIPKPPPVPKPAPQTAATGKAKVGHDTPTQPSKVPLETENKLKAETKRDPMALERAALTSPTASGDDAHVLDDELLDEEATTSGSQGGSGNAGSASNRFGDCEARIDAGDYVGARNLYRVMLRRDPDDVGAKAGIELTEGLKALAEGDRMEAAQRFEVVLELDPSNERAARELAEMRRHATNQRKGLLTRLLGQKGKG